MSSVSKKQCTKCLTVKVMGEYYVRHDSPDGHRNECKECLKRRANEAHAADPSRFKAAKSNWYQAHAEEISARKRDRLKEMSKEERQIASASKAAYYLANKGRISAYGKLWRSKNREEVRNRNRAWYEANQEYARSEAIKRYWADPEAAKARRAEWYQANREYALANAGKYFQENRERIHAYHANYRFVEQDKVRAHSALRTARLKAVLTIVPSAAQVAQKWDYWGGLCWMCRQPATTMDHVKPIRHSGPHVLANLRPACRSCNSRKHAKWFGPSQLERFTRP